MTADAREHLARVSASLATAPADVNAILEVATSALSRIRQATWVAIVMNSDPATSRVVVADDAERPMADYVDAYVAAIDRPHRAPTTGISQQVIESDAPIVKPRMTHNELLAMISEAGQEFMRANPPPWGADGLGMLIVPMRVGGAVIGSLGAFDWRHDQPFDESDLEWIQPVADRIALSVDHARLAGAVANDGLRLELIRAIGLSIRQRQDVGLITRVVVEQLTSRLDVDAADILLLSEGGGELVMNAAAGFRAPLAAGFRMPTSSMPVIGTTWKPHVEHLASGGRAGHNARASQIAREGFHTLVSVQLHARNRLLGVLELFNRSAVDWGQDWLDFYDTLGGLVGVATDHAAMVATAPARAREGQTPRPKLSDLEVEILRLIVEGFTNREIAGQVHRSENTVKFHVRQILEKTGTSNRTELARRATRESWL